MPAQSNPYPIVKWVGGKRQLQDRILAEFQKTNFDTKKNTYYEPFFGGGAILFALEPKKAVVNDLNEKLVNLYVQIRNDSTKVLKAAKKLQIAYNTLQGDSEKQLEFYLGVRSSFNLELPDSPEHAAKFLFLNKAGFNGMYRENSKGEFNIPFGRRDKINLFDDDNVVAVANHLQNVRILTGDFKDVFKSSPKPGDLVYFDPPYVPLTETAAFTGYTKDGFDSAMQQSLGKLAADLTAKGVYVAISNSSHADVTALYPGFERFELTATRMVAAKAKYRASVIEYLFTNFHRVNRA